MRRRAVALDREAGARMRETLIEQLQDLDTLYGEPGFLLNPGWRASADRLARLRDRSGPVRVLLDSRFPGVPDPSSVPDEYRLLVVLLPDDRLVPLGGSDAA